MSTKKAQKYSVRFLTSKVSTFSRLKAIIQARQPQLFALS